MFGERCRSRGARRMCTRHALRPGHLCNNHSCTHNGRCTIGQRNRTCKEQPYVTSLAPPGSLLRVRVLVVLVNNYVGQRSLAVTAELSARRMRRCTMHRRARRRRRSWGAGRMARRRREASS